MNLVAIMADINVRCYMIDVIRSRGFLNPPVMSLCIVARCSQEDYN